MTSNTYGVKTQASYLEMGEAIIRDIEEGNSSKVIKKINDTFFAGEVFAKKSFSFLTSIHIPFHPPKEITDLTNLFMGPRVEIKKRCSCSAVLGYIEGIPFIGTVIAIFNSIGHFFSMFVAYLKLKHAANSLKATLENDVSQERKESMSRTHSVFDRAVDYTVHRNHLYGSLLAIFPFVKPIVRLAQGLLYHASVRKKPFPEIPH